ncbi:GNAT family N-acetyltransferase [Devosia insulae DS-56]|uniref:GNAT family N-acetyltransferase n=1 Tax=Devosia insulae DS-56 TaxID=1116389 RepID=A0A1E5XRQ7_9HYPH|nr:GNAT family N-acetyltransferase [Devosia insulae]OEO31263.1 GNAT family N-acetyltransferase [Devosia insulae DS-56]
MPGHAIPTLRTRRLVLRAPVPADFDAYRDLMASSRSTFMGGPFDEARAWGLFCHDIACWTLFGHGALMIDVATTGECVGQVGINHGPLFPEKELGWLLYDGFEGQGYVTEAAAALRDWAFAELGLASLVSYFHPANARSIAVAQRLGAVRDDDAPRQDAEDLVYRHLPPGLRS